MMRIDDKLGMIALAGSKDWHDANFRTASATWKTIERVDDSDLFQAKLASGQTLVVSLGLVKGVDISLLSLLDPFGLRFQITFELDQVPFGPIRDTKEISSAVVRQTIEDLMTTLTPLARRHYLEIKEDARQARRNQVERNRRLKVEQAEALRRADSVKQDRPF